MTEPLHAAKPGFSFWWIAQRFAPKDNVGSVTAFRLLRIQFHSPPHPNPTELHGDSANPRIRRIAAQTFTCIRFGSIKRLVKGVAPSQRGYRANFWRRALEEPPPGPHHPNSPRRVKNPGHDFFSARVFDVSVGGIQRTAGKNLRDSSCR